MKKSMVALLCVSLLLMTGCGAMFQGSSQTVDIQSAPSGAKVTGQPGIGEYTTPTAVKLSRKYSYDLTFTKKGYQSATAHIHASASFGYIFLDVFFTGLIGVIVDAATGSWNSLSPAMVSVALEQEESGALGPDKIEIQLTTIGDDLLINSGDSPVEVKIERSK